MRKMRLLEIGNQYKTFRFIAPDLEDVLAVHEIESVTREFLDDIPYGAALYRPGYGYLNVFKFRATGEVEWLGPEHEEGASIRIK
jgi:hypothetical protein